jgi:hypothetical protein
LGRVVFHFLRGIVVRMSEIRIQDDI